MSVRVVMHVSACVCLC